MINILVGLIFEVPTCLLVAAMLRALRAGGAKATRQLAKFGL